MSWYPHITVATIVEREGRFLLVEEWDQGRLVLNQPAGHLDEGETLEQAAVREAIEETGWEVALQHITGIYLFTSPANRVTYLRTCYLASPVRERDVKLADEIERVLWLTRDEIEAARERWRSPLVLRCIDEHLAGRQFPNALVQSLL